MIYVIFIVKHYKFFVKGFHFISFRQFIVFLTLGLEALHLLTPWIIDSILLYKKPFSFTDQMLSLN